jgi:hypothetical protein
MVAVTVTNWARAVKGVSINSKIRILGNLIIILSEAGILA